MNNIKERKAIQFENCIYVIISPPEKSVLSLLEYLKEKFFIDIYKFNSHSELRCLQQHDFFFIEPSLKDTVTDLLRTYYPHRKVSIINLSGRLINKKTIPKTAHKLWDWIVECETGVK